MNRQLTYIAVFITGVLLLSCKKDKLEGEYSIFVGTWNWAYTRCDCNGITAPEDTLWPNDKGHTYSMEFKEKGKVCFYQDGDKTHCDRIVFEGVDEFSPGLFYFQINLNNDDNKKLNGYVWSDGMDLKTPPPYSKEDLGVTFLTNHYVKR